MSSPLQQSTATGVEMTNTTTIYHHEDFILNKYHNWYFKIIIKAQSEGRVKGGDIKYENHHIIPKSMGGSNAKDNLVLLTEREHYMTHLLITKHTTNSSLHKMLYAFMRMKGKSKNSHMYDSCRKKLSTMSSGENNPNYGLKHSHETKRKISKAGMGNTRWLGKSHTRESKIKIGRASKKRKHTVEAKRKMSLARIGHNNHLFTGYYVTPWGKFESSSSASIETCSFSSIQRWCKNSTKTISPRSHNTSKYLKLLPESPIGKTFKDIGFYFEPI